MSDDNYGNNDNYDNYGDYDGGDARTCPHCGETFLIQSEACLAAALDEVERLKGERAALPPQNLEAATAGWSGAPPTESGWYWWRAKKWPREVWAARVYLHNGALRAQSMGGGEFSILAAPDIDEWWPEPIAEPPL